MWSVWLIQRNKNSHPKPFLLLASPKDICSRGLDPIASGPKDRHRLWPGPLSGQGLYQVTGRPAGDLGLGSWGWFPLKLGPRPGLAGICPLLTGGPSFTWALRALAPNLLHHFNLTGLPFTVL